MNNGKEIKLSNVISNMLIDMIKQYQYGIEGTIYSVDAIQDDIDRYHELDSTIHAYGSLGMYKEFEDIVEDIWELLITYARISAYKALEIVDELPLTFIEVDGGKLSDKIDYILNQNYEKDNLVYLPYLFELICDVFSFYKVKVKIDNKGDIVRAYTRKDSQMEKKFIIKKFYLC